MSDKDYANAPWKIKEIREEFFRIVYRDKEGKAHSILTTERLEHAERLVAEHNALLGISTRAIKSAGVLRANLELFLMGWDMRDSECYAENMFPKWLLDLAGGIEDLEENGLTRESYPFMDDEEET